MIIHDRAGPDITTDGAQFAITPREFPYRRRATIRVGSRSFRAQGPAGSSTWERSRRRGQFYQEYTASIFPHAKIRVHDNVEVDVYQATELDLELLDTTFPLVPADHLLRVISAKPEGFRVVSAAGRGGSASYMGGLNPAFDDASTQYNETRCIQITYGALWENRHLGICPSIIHEIGHVMTHGGNGLNIARVDPERFAELGGVRVSRNAGRLEALCNAYMYFLCYGSSVSAVRRYGTSASIQKDARTRDALRACPAFTRLDDSWQARLAER